jgi:hypothetical protein
MKKMKPGVMKLAKKMGMPIATKGGMKVGKMAGKAMMKGAKALPKAAKKMGTLKMAKAAKRSY